MGTKARPRTKKRGAGVSAAPPPPPPPPAAVAGERLMTNEQATRLKALARDALELEAFHPNLTVDEAARRIRALEVKLKAMDGPPHTV